MKIQEKSEKLYSIGEVSKICNISKKALRYYDQIGILSPDVVSKENGYRYYSQKTLLLVPVVKYYKQMGFKLEEMQGLVEGNSYYYLEQNFRSKISELRVRENEIHNSYVSVSDWYQLLEEAQMVRKNKVQEVSIKYLTETTYCWQEQEFCYNYIDSIINVEWVNYLDSIENQITGPVVLNYSSYKDKMNGHCRKVKILQRPVLPCIAGSNKVTIGNALVLSAYHIGSLEYLDSVYQKMETWANINGYKCGKECYERYVVDYWTTRNVEEFVTEVIIPVMKKI